MGLVAAGPCRAGEDVFPTMSYDQEAYIQRYVDTRILAQQPPFDEIEAFAKDLRGKVETHQAFEGALDTYYAYLSFHATSTLVQPAIARWQQKNPTSPLPALVALKGRFINSMNDFALALGSNWIWHEPPQARGEIQGVHDELLAIKSYASADPYWYVLMAETIIALRRDRAELDQVVEEGLKKHPKNYELILTATAGYLSKWGGNSEALERFAQNVLALSTPEDGVANYARIYKVAFKAQYGVLMFDLAKADWQLLMTSTRELLKQAPSDAHLNDAAVMACAGGNRALTREALQHANFRYSDVYWYNIGTSWHPYEICRKWAGGE